MFTLIPLWLASFINFAIRFKKPKAYICLGFFIGFFIVFFPLQSIAGGKIRVTPVRVELFNGETIALLTVKNEGQTPTLIQTELLKWQQANNDEVLTASKDVLVSPPIFKLPALKQQNIRLGLRTKAPANVELAYRIKVSEVPMELDGQEPGLNVLVSFSVPIFVKPKKMVTNFVSHWTAAVQNKQLAITLKNAGNTHEQVKNIKIFNGDSMLAETNTMAYVLPAQSHQWTLTLSSAIKSHQLKVIAETDHGKTETDITID